MSAANWQSYSWSESDQPQLSKNRLNLTLKRHRQLIQISNRTLRRRGNRGRREPLGPYLSHLTPQDFRTQMTETLNAEAPFHPTSENTILFWPSKMPCSTSKEVCTSVRHIKAAGEILHPTPELNA